jgi:hypothetical protein
MKLVMSFHLPETGSKLSILLESLACAELLFGFGMCNVLFRFGVSCLEGLIICHKLY